MDLPPALSQAGRQGRLLLLWGARPFTLAAQPPSNRALALNLWAAQAETLPPPALALARLPPLPLLSLDPTGRVERAFAQAGFPLQVVRTRRDVPARGRHVLLKLAGDLGTHRGVVLSRAEVRELRGDPDKRHLLDEARRLAGDGALLLLGCDPLDQDFHAWWSALAPAFPGAALFALGEPSAAWPPGVTCLGPDLDALNAALWAAQPEAEASETSKPTRVFISSTWEDLQPEREAVEKALHRLRDTAFAGMEYFGSRPETPREVSLAEVDRSDVYIGLFAHRYGSGITEAEYRRARERGLPCLIYLKDDSVPVPPAHIERELEKITKLEALKGELKGHHTVSSFKSPDHLATQIVADLHNLPGGAPSVREKEPSQLREIRILRLDAAVPEQVYLNRAFDLAVAVRQLSSPVLDEDDLSRVHSGDVQVSWPEPYISLRVQISAPECEIHGSDSCSFRLYAGQDSPVFYFHLTPKKLGDIGIIVTVYQEHNWLGSTRVRTTVIHEQLVGSMEMIITSHTLGKEQRCADLAESIRETLELIKQYENQRRLADDPKAKRRAEQEVAALRHQLAEYEAEARELGCEGN